MRIGSSRRCPSVLRGDLKRDRAPLRPENVGCVGFLAFDVVHCGMIIEDQLPHVKAAERRAALGFLEKLRGRYDVAQMIMFGSRARGDHGSDSDLDLAMVLNGRRGDFIDVKLDMAGIAFDVMMDTGILVQAFPVWDDDLAHPERFSNPGLLRNIVEDGIRVG
jgi:predicted nucleotidyltransferase